MRRIYPLVVLMIGANSCHQKSDQTPPPPAIPVVEARAKVIPTRMHFIGRLQSNFDAVVQPRVNGYLLSKHYADGMPVHRGQLLFRIDPAQLSTTVLAAEAALESARAAAVEARNNYERALPLERIDAISTAQLDAYTARHKAAEAAVRQAAQALRNAQMDVSYTELRSPIDGVAAQSSAHAGDYVGPGTQFGVLTTVSNVDTLSVEVMIPLARYLELSGDTLPLYDNRELLSGIRLTLADGTRYPLAGSYDYTRKDISPTSGTISLVVLFPNPERRLKPGEFARIEANVGPERRQVTVPQRCVSQAQGINSVWVVGPDSLVRYRRVTPGATLDSLWCITEGLAAGEWVVAEGGQKLRNGEKITPQKR